MNIIELKKVSLKINHEKIINDISLQFKKGQITTLIGPNGGGKTSIAKIALQLITPTSGKVIADKKIQYGYMPQKINLDKSFTISAIDFIGLAKKNFIVDDYFKKLCDRLEINKILNQRLHDLSGGQLQKIIFLRAIIGKPDFLVLDEPTQYMDINGIAEFYQILNDIRNLQHCAILLVSHDLNFVMQKSDEVICVNSHICCHGSAESLVTNPQYLALFNKDFNVLKNSNSHNTLHDNSNNSSPEIGDEIAIYKHSHDHHH
jgi:zinc transport system ATP-binding protein